MEFDFDNEPEWQEWNSQRQNEMVPTSDIQPQSMQPPSAAESSGATATLDPNGTGGLFLASGAYQEGGGLLDELLDNAITGNLGNMEQGVFATASRGGGLLDELLEDDHLLDDAIASDGLPHVPPPASQSAMAISGPTGARLMKFIADKNCRMNTFRRRKMTLENAARDLSTLCDVDIAMVVYGPEQVRPEIWSSGEAGGIIDFYMLMRAQNKNKSTGMAEFFTEKAVQVEGHLRKAREKRYPIPGGEDWYNSREEMGQFLAAKIEAIRAKLMKMKDSIEAMKGKRIMVAQPQFVANLPSSAISEPGTSARGETSSPARLHVHLNGYINLRSVCVFFSSFGPITKFFLYRPSQNGVFTRLSIEYAETLKMDMLEHDEYIDGERLNWHDYRRCSDGSTPTNPLDSDFPFQTAISSLTAAGGAPETLEMPETLASRIVNVEITAITDISLIPVYFSSFGALLDFTLFGENCSFTRALIHYSSPHSAQRVISMGSGRLFDGMTWQVKVLVD